MAAPVPCCAYHSHTPPQLDASSLLTAAKTTLHTHCAPHTRPPSLLDAAPARTSKSLAWREYLLLPPNPSKDPDPHPSPTPDHQQDPQQQPDDHLTFLSLPLQQSSLPHQWDVSLYPADPSPSSTGRPPARFTLDPDDSTSHCLCFTGPPAQDQPSRSVPLVLRVSTSDPRGVDRLIRGTPLLLSARADSASAPAPPLVVLTASIAAYPHGPNPAVHRRLASPNPMTALARGLGKCLRSASKKRRAALAAKVAAVALGNVPSSALIVCAGSAALAFDARVNVLAYDPDNALLIAWAPLEAHYASQATLPASLVAAALDLVSRVAYGPRTAYIAALSTFVRTAAECLLSSPSSSYAQLPGAPSFLANVLPLTAGFAAVRDLALTAPGPETLQRSVACPREALNLARQARFYPWATWIDDPAPTSDPAPMPASSNPASLAPQLAYLARVAEPPGSEPVLAAWAIATVDQATGTLTDAALILTPFAVHIAPLPGAAGLAAKVDPARLPLHMLHSVAVAPLAFDSGLDPPPVSQPWGMVLSSLHGVDTDAALAKAPMNASMASRAGLWAVHVSMLASLVDDLELAPGNLASTRVSGASLPRVTAAQLMKLIVMAVRPAVSIDVFDPSTPCGPAPSHQIPHSGPFANWDAILHDLRTAPRPIFMDLPGLPSNSLLDVLRLLVSALSDLPSDSLSPFVRPPRRLTLTGVLLSLLDALELGMAHHFGPHSTSSFEEDAAFARALSPGFSLLASPAPLHEFAGPIAAVPRVDAIIQVGDALAALALAVKSARLDAPDLEANLTAAISAVADSAALRLAPVSFPQFPPIHLIDALYGSLHALYVVDADPEFIHRYELVAEPASKRERATLRALTAAAAASVPITDLPPATHVRFTLHPPVSPRLQPSVLPSTPDKQPSETLMREIALTVWSAAQAAVGPLLRVPHPHVTDVLHLSSTSKGRSANAKVKGAYTPAPIC